MKRMNSILLLTAFVALGACGGPMDGQDVDGLGADEAVTDSLTGGATFVGDMEVPLTNNFLLISELCAAVPRQVTYPVRRGSRAAKMVVLPGQKRSELQTKASCCTILHVGEACGQVGGCCAGSFCSTLGICE